MGGLKWSKLDSVVPTWLLDGSLPPPSPRRGEEREMPLDEYLSFAARPRRGDHGDWREENVDLEFLLLEAEPTNPGGFSYKDRSHVHRFGD